MRNFTVTVPITEAVFTSFYEKIGANNPNGHLLHVRVIIASSRLRGNGKTIPSSHQGLGKQMDSDKKHLYWT